MVVTRRQSQAAATATASPSSIFANSSANAMPMLPMLHHQNKRLKEKDNKPHAEDKPAFDYMKIFDLPTDVLFNILSFLSPETFYALSISSKNLSTFFYSRSAKTLWKTLRQRQTVYAPKCFIGPRELHYVRAPSLDGIFHFYHFTSQPTPASWTLVAITEAEISAEEDSSCHVALALPAPLDGITEFRLIRYLYGAACYHCFANLNGTGFRIPELLIALCFVCNQSQTTMFKEALDRFEATISSDRFDDLPHYYEFLLSRPFWEPAHEGVPLAANQPTTPRPTHRRIYSGHLDKDFTEFMRKKRSMAPPAFETWKLSNTAFKRASRSFAKHIQEYTILKETYDQYHERVSTLIRTRDERLLRQALRERMLSQMEYSWSVVDGVLDAHFIKHLIPKDKDTHIPRLDDDLWMKLLPSINAFATKYADYSDRRRLSSDELAFKVVTNHCDLTLADNTTWRDALHPGFYLKLPRLQAALWHSPGLPLAERQKWTKDKLREDVTDLGSDLVAIYTTVLRDLVKKSQPARSNSRKASALNSILTEYDINHLPLVELLTHLDDPELFYACSLCDEVLTWYDVTRHPCSANDLGERHYQDRELGKSDTRCISIGWQPDRIAVAGGFKGIYNILTAVSQDGSHADWDERRFPHGHAEMRDDHMFLFTCTVKPRCHDDSATWRMTQFMVHLATHIRKKEATLKTLAGKFRPYMSLEYHEEEEQDLNEHDGF